MEVILTIPKSQIARAHLDHIRDPCDPVDPPLIGPSFQSLFRAACISACTAGPFVSLGRNTKLRYRASSSF
jgi:hypothetical protein